MKIECRIGFVYLDIVLKVFDVLSHHPVFRNQKWTENRVKNSRVKDVFKLYD